MTNSKFLRAILMSASLLSGCVEPPPTGTDERVQNLMPPPQSYGNSNQAFGGIFTGVLANVRGIYYSLTPPAGAPPSASGWWIMSADVDQYAPIDQILYNSSGITSLTTVQGWLQVKDKRGTKFTLNQTANFTLDFLLGGAFRGMTLRLEGSTDGATYGQYKTTFSPDGTTWNTFCQHRVIDANNVGSETGEYMVPVGAKWRIDGRRVEDPAAISLSCTHDSIGGCVTWGYAPWDSVNGVSLQDQHQACTRMKRADFCGTGDSDTTLNLGTYHQTVIQVSDSLGVHPMNPQPPAMMEALWSTSGATCVNPTGLRTADTYYLEHLRDLLLNVCPQPACTSASTGLTGSARPCTAVDPQSGICTAN